MEPAQAKVERVVAALEGREADRVPVTDFFWTAFLERVRREWGADEPFDPYVHWDLDMVVVNPNMDPWIRGIEVVEETPERRVVRTGFGATIEQRPGCPMPLYRDFSVRTWEAVESAEFDDPLDPRRYQEAIDDPINGVADALVTGLPPFAERVRTAAERFCVFGGVCEPHEFLWRLMGSENLLMKLAEAPDRAAAVIARAGEFLEGIVRGQIAAAEGRLTGIYIWGDVAYDGGMFFSPAYWRRAYKPQVARLCRAAHEAGLKVIYHGCGNASAIFEDLIEVGVDAYNPVEAKAGLDVVDLKRRFGRRWAFAGNLDVRVLSTNQREAVRREVLRKLTAAQGGGYILQSDHSVPDTVAPDTYDYVVRLAREFGTYPLDPEALGQVE